MSSGHSELGRSLINAGFGRMSALGANRTRRDSGNDVNRTATGCCRRRRRWQSCAAWRGRDLARPGTPLVMSLGLARTKKNRRRPARNRRLVSLAPKRTGGGPRGTAARHMVLVVAYFRLAAAVRSNLRVTTNVALHQLEPSPAGLIGVKSPVNRAVWSLVNALQSPLFRLLS